AISFAATAAREFVRRGIEVQCVAAQPPDSAVRATISRARQNLDALLEMLALLRRDDSRTLDDLIDFIPRRQMHGAFVLVVGLGSAGPGLRLKWLRAGDNAVKVLDARGEEFARIFRRDTVRTASERAADEDLMLSLSDEELESAEV